MNMPGVELRDLNLPITLKWICGLSVVPIKNQRKIKKQYKLISSFQNVRGSAKGQK